MSDPRFLRLKTDPRFRRPKLKQTKVVIDDRFRTILDKQNKNHGPKVDKYGRSIPISEHTENLRKYYRLSDDAEHPSTSLHCRNPDLARGEVLLESSDEERVSNAKAEQVHDDEAEDSTEEEEEEEEEESFVTLGAEHHELQVNLDEHVYADLDFQAETYSKAYAQQENPTEDADQKVGKTTRLAVVNLDWDHVRAQHLYKIFSSLVSPAAPATAIPSSARPRPDYERQKGFSKGSVGHGAMQAVRGHVRSVRVYPSEFGKKRMEQEEKEGPPKEIFKKRREDVVNERTVYDLGDGEEGDYDDEALRKYQLERLRYYYAIVECDTVEAATHIYNELEGTELERSANVFDLSFVPQDMTFEGEPRDEATDDLNTEYKPIEFVTDALRHSKMKLTWDGDDPERHHLTRRALTKKEIEEGDFRNYVVGSSGESSDDDEGRNKHKAKNVKAKRDELRALLLGGNEDETPEGWGADGDARSGGDHDVDMEITFMPALSKKVGEGDETTLEKYQRKVKEKRNRRKEGKGKQDDNEKEKDEFFEASGDEKEEVDQNKTDQSSRGKKMKGLKETRKEATAAELALLVAPDKASDEPSHFNLKSVIKAEKDRKRKGKRGKGEEDNEAQEDFVVNVKDERFKALFENHQFAVDPSNPHFKKTKAMVAILEERQRRRREQVKKADVIHATTTSAGASGTNPKSLRSLVESVKRKSVNADVPGIGKRRKL